MTTRNTILEWIVEYVRDEHAMRQPGRFILAMLIFVLCSPAMVGAQGVPVSGQNKSGNESGAVLTLSLKQAVQVALAKDGSTRVRLAQELVRQARAQSAQQRSSLLPNFDSSATLQNRTTNLAAIGIGFRELPGGFSFPQFVGPFGTFD